MPPDPDDAIARYDYDLPARLIAQRPAPARDASRLLLLRAADPTRDCVFADLPELLEPGDLLVRNATRVIPARLLGRRGHAGGGRTELLLVRERGPLVWECLARPAASLPPGKRILFGAEGELAAVVEERLEGGRVRVRFELEEPEGFAPLLARLGEVPLPPYIERGPAGPDAEDRLRYQTVYASAPGAVAAPTAGLHFTAETFAALAARGVETADLVLHVGPGTFRPVQTESIAAHEMDEEAYEIPDATAEQVNRARAEGRRVIAVGTTAVRALEAASDKDGVVRAGAGETKLFIRPPYRFRIVSGLLTNFHLPRSTLLLLVAALAGRERLLDAYRHAVDAEYRFYSYGDAMLLLP